MTRKSTVLIYFATEALNHAQYFCYSVDGSRAKCECRELSLQRNRVKKVFNSHCSSHAVMILTSVPQYVNVLFAGVVHSNLIVFCLCMYRLLRRLLSAHVRSGNMTVNRIASLLIRDTWSDMLWFMYTLVYLFISSLLADVPTNYDW